jgi:hypothetical protein
MTGETSMTTKTNLKAGGGWSNHNETLVRDKKTVNLKVKTRVRAGIDQQFAYQKLKW